MEAVIELPDASDRDFARGLVERGEYPSIADYLHSLIAADRKERARKHLEDLLLESLKEPAVVLTQKDWDDMQQRLEQLFPEKGNA